MQYLLTEQELNNLVTRKSRDLETNKVRLLVDAFKGSNACRKSANMGYCDGCPIGSLDNGLEPYAKLCDSQDYSK
jgi:hypothetical protein